MASSKSSFPGQLGLTLYEQHRLPIPIATTETAIPNQDVLYKLLTCPICLELFDQPMAAPCLHRFCKKCITDAIAKANKECPLCRKKIGTTRSLRPDFTCEQLVKSIFPNPIQYEEQLSVQENIQTLLASQNSTITNAPATTLAIPDSSTPELLTPEPLAPEPLTPRPSTPPTLTPESDSPQQSSSQPSAQQSTSHSRPIDIINSSTEIYIEIQPILQQVAKQPLHPSKNYTRQVAISPSATVSHLARFLEIRYDVPSEPKPPTYIYTYPFTLLHSTDGHKFSPLLGSLSLAEVFANIPSDNWKLYFTYRMSLY